MRITKGNRASEVISLDELLVFAKPSTVALENVLGSTTTVPRGIWGPKTWRSATESKMNIN